MDAKADPIGFTGNGSGKRYFPNVVVLLSKPGVAHIRAVLLLRMPQTLGKSDKVPEENSQNQRAAV